MNTIIQKSFIPLFACCTIGVFAQKQMVTGIVSDENQSLPGAAVTIEGTKKVIITDSEGRFTISDLKEGQYNLKVSYIGFESKNLNIEIVDAQNLNVGSIVLYQSQKSIDEVIISGTLKNSEARALNMQKNAINISNVIASDGIGKLPDRNAAETVQRVQGVSIERDQGEGRFVSLRGLPPFWASTTINGNRLPTAEEETTSRATAFDFFPTELISYVHVNKSFTPDMEADGIGGGVNFITKTPPMKTEFRGTLGTGYNEKADKGVYNLGLLYGGRTKNKKFGYLVNFSHFIRNWSTDNFEARRSGDEGVFRMELRDYQGVRKTTGANAALEYVFSPKSTFYLKGMYGTLSDDETHYKHRVRFDKFSSTNNTARVELQNIHNLLITELTSVSLGGIHQLNKSKIDWDLSYYNNLFKYGNIPDKQNNSYYVIKYTQNGVGINPNYILDKGVGPRAYWKADGGKLDYKDPDALFGFYSDPNFKMDASQMRFTDLEFYKVYVQERDKIVAGFNHEIDISDKLTLKYGFKYRDKERNARFSDIFYNWSNGTAPFLSEFGQYTTTQPNGTKYLSEMNAHIGNTFGPVLSTGGMDQFWFQNQGNLTINKTDSEALEYNKALGRNFDVFEKHADAYGIGTYKINDKMTILGGVRLSNTHTKVKGYNVVNNTLTEVENTKDYLAVLPMLHFKYAINDKTNLRFAATRTFSRPNFGDLTPGGTYIEADNEFKGGNPNLNPTYSINLDLMGEYYFSNVGILSGGVFYKSITDPIFQDSFIGNYNGINGVQFSAPNNGKAAWLGGIELGINRRFDFLPGFLQYFGTQLNATFMTSEMEKPSGRKVKLPYQAKEIYNIQLFFEKGGFNARLAYNHKGNFAVEYAEEDLYDSYYGKYSNLDFGTSYQINKHFTVFADVNNILNKPLIYHFGENQDRPEQVEYYGVRGNIGVKVNF
ncbi:MULTISPECIES: TonB-dependent receptor [Chryseobacterium]|uniref:TonB-dependent receptor n=1 Tax=Chryseobacterium TaxID=59732 RepID=UPI001958F1A6|nr:MULTISPECIES: TonB-dependent receptor [Chryseobacterium]MBM7419482.1 TonB-dependent receptor [Chryseobacterium sp. JUb44]MDH6209410.1 TonB-dependent receptor [Chryseobacterium sp. BIGb0186]WSO12246.1 TonB-dependent receptor [Chryseobacterium scophthalmum]